MSLLAEGTLVDPGFLHRTPLHALHVELGARMVPFAGYDMPVQYPTGILAEHRHTRAAAGLFDVSHMGQVFLRGAGAVVELERLVPGDVRDLAPGAIRYTMFTAEDGGILDDLMVTRGPDHLFLVVNAGRKVEDVAHLRARIAGAVTVEERPDLALLALQGPAAARVLDRLAPGAGRMTFMTQAGLSIAGIACTVSRSGYTGEDGFEISVPGDAALGLARRLLAETEVRPIGLGARDSLRLEAGLCLHGHDIDGTTTPIEAGLAWTIAKRRRQEGGFPGADIVLRQLREGPSRRRVGLVPEGQAPAREGTEILDAAGLLLGKITSGGFGPTLGGPLAMGYVAARAAAFGTKVQLMVRGTAKAAAVAPMPFVPHRYAKP